MSTLTDRIPFTGLAARPIRALRRARRADCLTILTYHSIAPEPAPFIGGAGLTLHPTMFEDQMAYVARHYRPLALRDAIAAIQQGRPLDRAVVVTFDDGFADNLRIAAPILRRAGIPATICVCTSVVGNLDLLWRHRLAWLLASPHARRAESALRGAYRASGITPREDESVMDLTRRAFAPTLLPPLLDDLLREAGTSGPELADRFRPYLDPADLANADPRWIDFANHTHTHPVLSALSRAAQRTELRAAFERIYSWTGRPPIAVAYPFGLRDAYTETTRELVRATGHHAALDLRRRVNRPGVDPLELSRKPAPTSDLDTFQQAVEEWPAAGATRREVA